MDTLIQTLRVLHITAGFASLVLFWIPIFTHKGGKQHRSIGKAYVTLMWIVVGTAALLSIKNAYIGKGSMAAFLGFISLITANPLWYGRAILKHKQGTSRGYRRTHLAFRMVIILSGIALISYGIYLDGKGTAILMFIFGALGLTDIPHVIRAFRHTEQPIHWFREHIIGMCTSGIAAYTAFLVFGAHRFLESWISGYWSVVPWIAPSVLGSVGIALALRYYRKQGKIA